MVYQTGECKVVEKYRGWQLKAYHQQAWPPFKQYVCVASKTIDGAICSWNLDGVSIRQATNLVKECIDDNDVPGFKDFPKLVGCSF